MTWRCHHDPPPIKEDAMLYHVILVLPDDLVLLLVLFLLEVLIFPSVLVLVNILVLIL